MLSRMKAWWHKLGEEYARSEAIDRDHEGSSDLYKFQRAHIEKMLDEVRD